MSSAMWNRDGTLSYDSRDQPAKDQSGECLLQTGTEVQLLHQLEVLGLVQRDQVYQEQM